MSRTTVAVLLMSTALLGCTSLAVRPLDPATSAPARGYQYSLPFAYYKISVVRTLKGCDDSISGAKFSFDVAVSATPKFGPDPNQTFVIDNSSLVNWFKTSDISVERFENRMLKSIGASATDLTGSVLSSAAGGVVKLAQAAVLSPAGNVTAPRGRLCSGALLKTVNGIKQKRAAMTAATASVEAETDKLKQMREALTLFGQGTTATAQDRLLNQVNKLIERTSVASKVRSDYENDVDAITDTHTFYCPPDGRTVVGDYKRDDRKWMRKFVAKDSDGVGQAATDVEDTVKLRIVPSYRLTVKDAGGIPALPVTGGSVDGIRYRDPVIGALQVSVCKDIDPKTEEQCADSTLTRDLAEGPVPQLGRLMLIPYDNYIFQDNKMEATFNEDGSLLKASHGEKASRAKVASDTLSEIAETLLQGTKTLQTAGIDARTAVLKARKGLLEEQAALEEAQLALLPKPTVENDRRMAILASDTALREALLKNLEAKQALEKARVVKP